MKFKKIGSLFKIFSPSHAISQTHKQAYFYQWTKLLVGQGDQSTIDGKSYWGCNKIRNLNRVSSGGATSSSASYPQRSPTASEWSWRPGTEGELTPITPLSGKQLKGQLPLPHSTVGGLEESLHQLRHFQVNS
jgi:hypothetical protein